jgi:hypothetical protein
MYEEIEVKGKQYWQAKEVTVDGKQWQVLRPQSCRDNTLYVHNHNGKYKVAKSKVLIEKLAEEDTPKAIRNLGDVIYPPPR